jgi:hypothetical protein
MSTEYPERDERAVSQMLSGRWPEPKSQTVWSSAYLVLRAKRRDFSAAGPTIRSFAILPSGSVRAKAVLPADVNHV